MNFSPIFNTCLGRCKFVTNPKRRSRSNRHVLICLFPPSKHAPTCNIEAERPTRVLGRNLVHVKPETNCQKNVRNGRPHPPSYGCNTDHAHAALRDTSVGNL